MTDAEERNSEGISSYGRRKKVVGKETRLGLSHGKDEDFGKWYSEVFVNSEMIGYYDISGCYIIRHWVVVIWDIMKEFFDMEIEEMEVEKTSLRSACFLFLLLVLFYKKEETHVAGFEPEEVEKDVKERTKGNTGAAKTLCTPFDQPEMHEGTKCFASGKLAKKWSYWGRSY
ncbi:hypothetical protein QYF36_001439 [Acer negundo]|nr:hypothetical protein QYF36_001439 [Acer negundo]